MNKLISTTFHSLLADCSRQTGVPLVPPEDIEQSWVLIDAPKLDKEMLSWLERNNGNWRLERAADAISVEYYGELIYRFSNSPTVLIPKCRISVTRRNVIGLLILLTEDSADYLEEASQGFPHGNKRRREKAVTQVYLNEIKMPEFPEWLIPLWAKIIQEDNPVHVRAMHQILVFCYKAEQEPTYDQIKTAQASFEQNNTDCGQWDLAFSESPSTLLRTARSIVSRIIYSINWQEVDPSHGPGAVFPRLDPVSRSSFPQSFRRLMELYPRYRNFDLLPSYWYQAPEPVVEKKPILDEIITKLVAVPKDSRGPRLICVHPAEAIWIQQGQRKLLEDAVTKNCMTRGFINFGDQTINGKLALSSSRDREYCTLDLKDASDRVSKGLVRLLFGEHAWQYLSCTRADKVQLIDDRVIDLNMYAPMGNATTFPVEAIVFWCLVKAGIQCLYGSSVSRTANVYVFGDDILFPVELTEGAVYGLTSAGLRVNMSKTYKQGFFRESCGVDAYRGTDITPLRLRKVDVGSASNCVGLCDLAKRARLQGFEQLSATIYSQVRTAARVLPLSNNPDCQGLTEYNGPSWTSLIKYEKQMRWNRKLHIWETPTRLLKASIEMPEIHDWYHVQDSIMRITRGGSDRQTEYPIPYRERLEYGWTEARPPAGSWDKENVE